MNYDAAKAATYLAAAHASRAPYRNLPDELAPQTFPDAYAVQEALARLWQPLKGPVRGLKIATTTKVMQDLMGIDHPCGGMIFDRTIHASPFVLSKRNYMNVVVECELAVRVGRDLPKGPRPYTRGEVREAIDAVMPAFELIEDRKAVYKECAALSLVADNAWNAGIVTGPPVAPPAGMDLDRIEGILTIDGKTVRSGKTDDPMGALAWVANLAADRGRPLTAGMVVITGSVIATLPIEVNETFDFTLEGLGNVTMKAVA